jgi:hypothetical protein
LIAGYEAWDAVEDEVTGGDVDHRALGEEMGLRTSPIAFLLGTRPPRR